MKTINLDFDGYWREINKDGVPSQSGIYCVYSCTYNSNNGKVSIKKLLYIGESTDVHNRIANHDRLDDWKKIYLPMKPCVIHLLPSMATIEFELKLL